MDIFCTFQILLQICDYLLINGLSSSASWAVNALYCDYFPLCQPTGNTRVISQNALQTFQDEMGKVLNDPYKVFQPDTH